jgi:hypothetical protein
MMDLTAVMVTMDRSPGKNYLEQTLRNLANSDLLTCERLHSLCIVDSKAGHWAYDIADDLLQDCPTVKVFSRDEDVMANENVSDALYIGHQTRTDWTIFLEDDIDVCGQFFESVGRWLDDYGHPSHKVHAFGAAYPQVEERHRDGLPFWEYPVDQFYGTQCFAVDNSTAFHLSEYIMEHKLSREPDGTGWDLLMADWAGPGSVFLASCPSFVQHIGMTSTVRPRKNIHTFDSWPGNDWSYKG